MEKKSIAQMAADVSNESVSINTAQQHTPGPWRVIHIGTHEAPNNFVHTFEVYSEPCEHSNEIGRNTADLIQSAPETAAERDTLIVERDRLKEENEAITRRLNYAAKVLGRSEIQKDKLLEALKYAQERINDFDNKGEPLIEEAIREAEQQWIKQVAGLAVVLRWITTCNNFKTKQL